MSIAQENAYSPKESLTFEKVWAMFQELREDMKETDRRMKDTDRRMKETDRIVKETALQMKETDRRIGELGNRFGELAEHLVAPSIMEKFNARGFMFTRCSDNFKLVEGDNPQVITEVDILLENGDIAVAVEVKAKPSQKDVDEHILRLGKLRAASDRRKDGLKYQGAIAGAIMSNSVRQYTIHKGMYVIEQTGDSVAINVPEGFKPTEW